jgi:Fic family protein
MSLRYSTVSPCGPSCRYATGCCVSSTLCSCVRAAGADKSPGEFRRTQNWIGLAGCTLTTASSVPPPSHVMESAMTTLETFVHDSTLPVLVPAGLVHAQFETIHPFLDGNGRAGRMFISLLLRERDVLAKPVLYLSTFLKRHQARYFKHLTAVRSAGRGSSGSPSSSKE